MGFYQGVDVLLMSLLFWWVLLFIFQRVSNRYPEKNSWKKDVFITFLQSVVVLAIVNVIRVFSNSF
ncbi:hypothetical protein [Planomicrobium okeanokoites]|uniref:hypothetical protein n=1 Tax=Planomicrobium okeanokoites TaxID=244 RepID=UPI000A052232|nr:hypothetical protein [Planomicrobium okeanokoites]